MPRTRRPLLLLALLAIGCGELADSVFCPEDGCHGDGDAWSRWRTLSPRPSSPPRDPSNELVGNPDAESIGKAFFFDPAFSGVATQLDAIKRPSPAARTPKGSPVMISCATCHDLARGGADTSSVPGHVSVGAGWTDVNALSVINSASRALVFWNGRADSLWALNAAVAESATTLNGNRLNTAHQIISRYRLAPFAFAQLAKQFPSDSCATVARRLVEVVRLPPQGKKGGAGCTPADPGEPFGDSFDCLTEDQKTVVDTLLVVWAKAIAAFEARLVTRGSPFDRFVAEGPTSAALSPAARRGARLFVGKASCIDCHAGPELTDEKFHDIGVPQFGLAVPTTADCPAGAPCDCVTPVGCEPYGAYDGLARLRAKDGWGRHSRWSDAPADASRDAYLTMPLSEDLKGAWRTPSLRNVALTAPYMHDGRYATLAEVVRHYDTGGREAGPERVGTPAAQLKPLLLDDEEVGDLVAFLASLTDEPLPVELVSAPELPPLREVSEASLASELGCL